MTGFDMIRGSDLESAGVLKGLEQSRRNGSDGIGRSDGGGDSEFGGALLRALDEVGDLRADVKANAEALARGEPVEVHDLMIAMGKSDVAFSLMLEVRNKMVEAWQTLSRSVV